ncbi:MAG: methionine-R-sulfoxide reductase [Candidatus Lutacidiplasmatales archaeon]
MAPSSTDGYRKLTRREEDVIVRHGTEPAFSGEYEEHFEAGTYQCKRCGSALYRSDDKFDAKCGWPSFDQEIEGAVRRLPDPDGQRVEIRCANCDGHLGHVFSGERFTPRNTRHCVNSISLSFRPIAQDREPR